MKGNIFRNVEHPRIKKTMFDLSHDHKTTFDMGEIIPVCSFETYPSDFISYRPEIFLRFAPLVAPVMHDIDVRLHCFFVPNRILWSGFEDFIDGVETAGAHPYFTVNGVFPAAGS